MELEVNDTGVHRKVKSTDGKRAYYILVCNPGERVENPTPGTIWWDSIVAKQLPDRDSLRASTTRSRAETDETNGAGTAAETTDAEDNTTVSNNNPPPNKKASTNQQSSAGILKQTYWEQKEAQLLFDPKVDHETVEEAIQQRIEALKKVNASDNGWMDVTAETEHKIATKFQIFMMRHKALFITLALQNALQHMNSWSFHKCCCEAVAVLNSIGITSATNGEVVRRWHQAFRDNGNRFVENPQGRKHVGPLLFYHFPDGVESFCTYANQNLGTLNSELMLQYVLDTLVPDFMRIHNEESETKFDDPKLFLRHYGYRNICTETVCNWLNHYGYRYCARQKGYYNDKHEEPSNVMYRYDFIDRYFGYELQSFRWIQIPKSERDKYVNEGILSEEEGYKYREENINMYEFHIDRLGIFREQLNKTTLFGGNLSVRRDKTKKPLIIFGQDEAIFKQFLFRVMQWTGPDGRRPLLPKDEGQGVMLSVFQSREFGFGFFHLTNEQLEQVNAFRQGRYYSDQDAAVLAGHKDGLKQPLQEHRFYVEFDYGAARDGYWTYEWMIVQLEDCVDVLRVLYPEYDFVFLFDHSCGHDRQREDGLNVNKLGKSFGGAHPKLRDSKMVQADGYLGSYEHSKKLKVGETQSMVFKATDEGPCWLTPEERENQREDWVTPQPTTDKNRKELIADLQANNLPTGGSKTDLVARALSNGIPTTKPKVTKKKKDELILALQAENLLTTGTKDELIQRAQNNGIATTKQIDHVVQGWVGKPKGRFQILWERGFIDPNKTFSDYTKMGTTDRLSNTMKETSLDHLMSLLYDFSHEETLLQYHGRKLRVIIDRSPKAHCEIAGEGIEYSWAMAKNTYRRLPISEKRSKETFRKSVRNSLSRDVLTTKLIRSYSSRARRYMVSYKALKDGFRIDDDSDEVVPVVDEEERATPIKLERLRKAFKTHRCAMDFDLKFVLAAAKKHTPSA